MKTKSEKNGKKGDRVRVVSVTPKGIGIIFYGKDYFLSYEHFPELQYLTAPELGGMTSRYGDDLYIPAFGFEYEIENLEDPEKYNLTMSPIINELPELPRKKIIELKIETRDGKTFVRNAENELVDITGISDAKEA